MFKFIDYFKHNILTFLVIAIIFVVCEGSLLIALNNTYAVTYTIIFNRYEDTEIMDNVKLM